jgi:hypothetical protein
MCARNYQRAGRVCAMNHLHRKTRERCQQRVTAAALAQATLCSTQTGRGRHEHPPPHMHPRHPWGLLMLRLTDRAEQPHTRSKRPLSHHPPRRRCGPSQQNTHKPPSPRVERSTGGQASRKRGLLPTACSSAQHGIPAHGRRPGAQHGNPARSTLLTRSWSEGAVAHHPYAQDCARPPT